MAVQFISTNKNYKRLYDAPLDPTVTQETYDKMIAYLEDPTCYVNQIIGCEGIIYIVYEKDGQKFVKETSGTGGGGGFYEGTTPPENTDLLWIDTSDDEFDSTIESPILDEFRAILSAMQEKINKLEEEVEYLKLNGGGTTPPPVGGDYYIITEEGDIFITEDGDEIVSEDYVESSTENYLITETNETIITEDDFNIILEGV